MYGRIIDALMKAFPGKSSGDFRWNVNAKGKWEVWMVTRWVPVAEAAGASFSRKGSTMKFVSEFPQDTCCTKVASTSCSDGSLLFTASNRQGYSQNVARLTPDGVLVKIALDKGQADKLGLKCHNIQGRWYLTSLDGGC